MWQLWRGDRQQSADSRQGPEVTPIYCHTDTIHCRGSTPLLSDEYPLLSIENSIFTGDIIADTVTVSCQALSLCSCQLACWCCQDLCLRLCYGSGHGTASHLRYQLLTQCLNIVTSGHLHMNRCWRDVFQFLIRHHCMSCFVNVHLYKCRCHVGERKRQIPHWHVAFIHGVW